MALLAAPRPKGLMEVIGTPRTRGLKVSRGVMRPNAVMRPLGTTMVMSGMRPKGTMKLMPPRRVQVLEVFLVSVALLSFMVPLAFPESMGLMGSRGAVGGERGFHGSHCRNPSPPSLHPFISRLPPHGGNAACMVNLSVRRAGSGGDEEPIMRPTKTLFRPGGRGGRAAGAWGWGMLLGGLLGGPAGAAPVTVRLVGHVISVDDPERLLAGSVPVGSALAGEYTFDTATPDAQPDPSLGVYHHRAAPAGIGVTVGHYRFANDPGEFDLRVQIFHHPADPDSYAVASHDNLPLDAAVNVREIFWYLADEQGTTLSSDHLPATPPDLTRFSALNRFYLAGEGGPESSYLIVAVIDQAVAGDSEAPAAPAPAP